MNAAAKQTPPAIGDSRWRLETITNADVEALARKSGWPGGLEGVREFCEPNEAARYSTHASLEAAATAARAHLETGEAFYGCAIVDCMVFEAAADDRGNLIRGVPPEWVVRETYEIARDGECIKVNS
jgi:hypothetical protein